MTNCYQLKMLVDDGKMRLTDVASPETLLRLIQSVPSPKAEPIESKPISRNDATTQRKAKPKRYFQRNQYRLLVKATVELLSGSRRKPVSAVRKRLIRLFVGELGLPQAEIARILGITAAAVAKTLVRRE